MNILFVSYWESEDGLTRATVIPHLLILQSMPAVNKIIYCSIERTKRSITKIQAGDKIVHVPLFSGKSYYHKIVDFLTLPRRLKTLVREFSINVVICRGALAGSLGYLLNRSTGVDYIVESFEPHADYMAEASVWRSGGMKYRLQSKWEQAQLLTAQSIVTVSQSYKNHLITHGLNPSKVFTAPCAVEIEKFSFNASKRAEVRAQLQVTDDSIVGIYTGKFGGLYYDLEAFEIFAIAFRCIKRFRLIILTPDNVDKVRVKLTKAGILAGTCYVGKVSHDAVPHFLCAADFAFALYRTMSSSKSLSPVKIGEYWANGLPVLLTEGVGDDSEIINEEGGGITFHPLQKDSTQEALRAMEKLVRQGSRDDSSESNCKLAIKHRNFERVKEVYEKIFSSL